MIDNDYDEQKDSQAVQNNNSMPGKRFIEQQKGVDAYFIYGDELGNYQVWHTDGLKKYIELP